MKNNKVFLSFVFAATIPFTLAQAATTQPNAQINLNTADSQTLMHSVKGIGAKRAESITKYRTEHGQFKSIEEMANIPGFGKKFVASHHDELIKLFTVK